MTENYLLCGVGGQGVVLASKLLASAAMAKGAFVRTTDTIGMAQRGGSVMSHVRVGENTQSAMVPLGTADVIFGFEPGEAVRALAYLKKDGMMVVNTKAIQPVTAGLGLSSYDGSAMIAYLKQQVKNLVLVDGDGICRACGSPKVLNIALLGAAGAEKGLGLSLEDLEKAMEQNLKEKFLRINLKALALGAKGNRE